MSGRADRGWLPIYSAPRDGSKFWSVHPRSCGVFETWWVKWKGGGGFFCLDGGERWSSHPSHWKPKLSDGSKPGYPGMFFYDLPPENYEEPDLIERAAHASAFVETDNLHERREDRRRLRQIDLRKRGAP